MPTTPAWCQQETLYHCATKWDRAKRAVSHRQQGRQALCTLLIRQREGVFIPRRDTASRLNTVVGGRLFPGEHYHARFHVEERDGHYRIALDSDDGRTHLAVEGHVASELPKASIFDSLEKASEFFEQGSLGYSVTAQPGRCDHRPSARRRA